MNESTDSEYPIDASFRRTMFLCGGFFASFAVAIMAFCVVDGGRGTAAIMTALVSVGFASAAVWSIRIAMLTQRQTVRLGPEGLRVGSSRFIHWDEIAFVRERSGLQRLDLLDHAGKILVAIEFQVRDIDEVIDSVCSHARLVVAEDHRRFGQRRALSYIIWNSVVFGGFSALGVWLWVQERHWAGVVLPVAMVWAFYTEIRGVLREVEITPSSVFLRTLFGEEIIHREHVKGIVLMLKPTGHAQRSLDVALVLNDGRVRWAKPRNQQGVEIYAALKAWYPDAAAA